jgi:hypothetical protein
MKIAVVGGGISGVVTSIELAKLPNISVHLFEKRNTLLKGPPYCHLHAGGFLYPDISLQDCETLLRHSIDFALAFQKSIHLRPTIVAYNSLSRFNPQQLIFRCNAIKYIYNTLPTQPFGPPSQFFAIYSYENALHFKQYGVFLHPNEFHDPHAAKFLNALHDLHSIKFPFASVNEPGINQQSVESKCMASILRNPNITVFLNSHFDLLGQHNYDFIINATAQSFSNSQELFELKSSWLIENPICLPEIAIIGERNTDHGLLQITPVGNCTYQIHLMTPSCSIIQTNTQPITNHIPNDTVSQRTLEAIKNVSKLFPCMQISTPLNIAECGVQRIPSGYPSNRISRFVRKNDVIDIQLLKATSVVTIANQISKLFV